MNLTSETMVLADGRQVTRHLVVENAVEAGSGEWSVALDSWAARVYLSAEVIGGAGTVSPTLSTRSGGKGTAGEVGTKGRAAVIVAAEPPMVFLAPPPGVATLFGKSNLVGPATEVRTVILMVGF